MIMKKDYDIYGWGWYSSDSNESLMWVRDDILSHTYTSAPFLIIGH